MRRRASWLCDLNRTLNRSSVEHLWRARKQWAGSALQSSLSDKPSERVDCVNERAAGSRMWFYNSAQSKWELLLLRSMRNKHRLSLLFIENMLHRVSTHDQRDVNTVAVRRSHGNGIFTLVLFYTQMAVQVHSCCLCTAFVHTG
jgi:hypothetical protein